MTFATHPRAQRILVGGAVALGAVFVAGAVVQVPRTEADLATRVESVLADQGMVVRAEFSGQDGRLQCTAPLADLAEAVTFARNVWGVRVIEVDVSCGVVGVPTTTTSTSVPTSTTTVESTVATTTVPSTTSSSTTAPSTTSPVAAPDVFTATLQDGTVILAGTVASDLERLALIDRARNALSASNVVNNLTVDTQVSPVPAAQFIGLLDVVALMPTNLVSGALGWNGDEVSLTGLYATEANRAAIGAAAVEQGVAATLSQRTRATAAQAAALEVELNALVAEQPILFEKGSVTISLSSLGTVQQVAGIAKRYGGLTIEVQGHTDSEGDPGRNLTLSEQRAAAVRDALISMGVPATDLTSTGFGITQLITDDNGNELPDKSRRVVFGVTRI